MIQPKEAYITPTTDTLELRSEGFICQSGVWGNPNDPGSGLIEDPNYSYDF